MFYSFSLAHWSLKDSMRVFKKFQHSKIMLLPPKLIKFKIVGQSLFWLAVSFLTWKILICPMVKKLLGCWIRVFQGFQIYVYSESISLTLKKTKDKLCIWEYFCTFTWVFYVITRVMGDILVFLYFLKKKLRRKVVDTCSTYTSE